MIEVIKSSLMKYYLLGKRELFTFTLSNLLSS